MNTIRKQEYLYVTFCYLLAQGEYLILLPKKYWVFNTRWGNLIWLPLLFNGGPDKDPYIQVPFHDPIPTWDA